MNTDTAADPIVELLRSVIGNEKLREEVERSPRDAAAARGLNQKRILDRLGRGPIKLPKDAEIGQFLNVVEILTCPFAAWGCDDCEK